MQLNTVDKNMAAIAFAEAGEHQTAKEMLGGGSAKKVKVPGPASKPYGSTLIFGTISIFAYVLLFKNEKLITDIFTMGGWRWMYPVGVAFFFSFIHGAFASNLLSSLSIEAKK